MRVKLTTTCLGVILLAWTAATAGPKEDLKSPDPIKRSEAAQVFGSYAHHNREAVAALRTLLKDPHPSIRAVAARELARFGSEARDAVHDLIPNLNHQETSAVRKDTCYALQMIGPYAKPAVPALIELLKDPECEDAAMRALWFIGPGARDAVPALHAIFKDLNKSREARRMAATALSAIGFADPDLMKTVIEFLRNRDDWESAWSAVHIAGGIGPEAKEAIPLMLALYRSQGDDKSDKANRIRESLVDAFGKMGSGAKPIVPELVRILTDTNTDGGVRRSAAYAIKSLGPHANDAVPLLIEIMRDPQIQVERMYLSEALAGIGPKAIPALLEVIKDEKLKDQGGSPRPMAVWALGRMGPPARSAVPTLLEYWRDKEVGSSIASVLQAIQPGAGVEPKK